VNALNIFAFAALTLVQVQGIDLDVNNVGMLLVAGCIMSSGCNTNILQTLSNPQLRNLLMGW